MYKGYSLSNVIFPNYKSDMIKKGTVVNTRNRKIIEHELKSRVNDDIGLDASKLQNHWFPQIAADVFISHSHKDKELALCLAGWLKSEFSLSAFIDSCVWGYSDELLRMIDNEYCLNPGGKTYSYENRNGSTSHVHMMLSTALGMMIDNTECLVFLNTPNSILPRDSVYKTKSPWIYAEIAFTSLIRRKKPSHHRELNRLCESAELRKLAAKKLDIEYILPTNSLIDINGKSLAKWQQLCSSRDAKGSKALDILYNHVGVQD